MRFQHPAPGCQKSLAAWLQDAEAAITGIRILSAFWQPLPGELLERMTEGALWSTPFAHLTQPLNSDSHSTSSTTAIRLYYDFPLSGRYILQGP
jgi:hypothetical protein